MKYADMNPIGVCSWSLSDDASLLQEVRRETGVECVHLSLNPALDGRKGYAERFVDSGWTIPATMVGFAQEDYTSLRSIRETGGIVPEAVWPQNRARVLEAIRMTRSLKVPYLEFHFGFIDESDRRAFETLAARVRQLADAAADNGVVLLMETGQETASNLLGFIECVDHPALAVNFDPGNMILYGRGNPVEAVGILGRRIRHVHIKDALPSAVAGQWGTETVWGKGSVGTRAFLKSLKDVGYAGALSIEREAGSDRIGDIESAVRLLLAPGGIDG